MNEGYSNINWKAQLRQALMDHFGMTDLRTLCFDIDLDFESIEQSSKDDTVIEIINYCIRSGRVEELITLGEVQRPNVPWNDIAVAARQDTRRTTPIPLPIRERHPIRETASSDLSRPTSVPRREYPYTEFAQAPRQPAESTSIGINQLIPWLVGAFGLLALMCAGGTLLYTNFPVSGTATLPVIVTPTLQGLETRAEDSSSKVTPKASSTVVQIADVPSSPTSTATSLPTHTPTSTPTKPPTVTPVPTSGGSPVLAPLNTNQAAAWFPILNNLQASGTGQVRNTDLYSGDTLAFMNNIGRLISYERNYQHADFCESPDGLEDVYIQAFYFKDQAGAVSFMDWATDSWRFPGVIRQHEIGNSSYYIKKQNTTLEGGDCLLEVNSFTFQKQNIVYRTVVYTRDGTWDDGDSYNYAKSIARLYANAVPD